MTADRYKPLSGTQHILIVESDILVRAVVAEYLRECGLLVIEAIDAAEAMAVHSSDLKIDATLINIVTIGETVGFELARRIRSANPQARVVLTSTVANMAREVDHLCNDDETISSHRGAMLEPRLRRLLRR
jgi:DNA-binding NtrC family response regulator